MKLILLQKARASGLLEQELLPYGYKCKCTGWVSFLGSFQGVFVCHKMLRLINWRTAKKVVYRNYVTLYLHYFSTYTNLSRTFGTCGLQIFFLKILSSGDFFHVPERLRLSSWKTKPGLVWSIGKWSSRLWTLSSLPKRSSRLTWHI